MDNPEPGPTKSSSDVHGEDCFVCRPDDWSLSLPMQWYAFVTPEDALHWKNASNIDRNQQILQETFVKTVLGNFQFWILSAHKTQLIAQVLKLDSLITLDNANRPQSQAAAVVTKLIMCLLVLISSHVTLWCCMSLMHRVVCQGLSSLSWGFDVCTRCLTHGPLFE